WLTNTYVPSTIVPPVPVGIVPVTQGGVIAVAPFVSALHACPGGPSAPHIPGVAPSGEVVAPSADCVPLLQAADASASAAAHASANPLSPTVFIASPSPLYPPAHAPRPQI